jgi:type I restriction enzyme S subunit
MNSWKKQKLGIVADVKLSNVDKLTNENERPVRLCNYTDVYKNSFINLEKSESFMLASCNENEYEKFILKKGQVAITKDSETPNDIGVSTYISEDFEDVVLGYHLALITPDKDKLDGQFLHYWLNTKQAKRYFENNAGGSGQRCTLVLDCIKSTPLYLPNLSVQKSIAKVLSDLDAKIELNNRINRELEAMAKTLYDYWFVQFDFPYSPPTEGCPQDGVGIGKPYKSSGGKMVYNAELKREIPEGWEVKKLGKCIKIFDSQRIPLSNKERELKKGTIPYYGATGIMDYVDDYIFNDDYILLAEDGSVMNENGFPIIQFIWGKTWVNNHAHVIQANDKEQNEFYYQHLSRIPVVLIKTGSIQMKINQDNLKNHHIIVPPKTLINKYSKTAISIRKSLINNIEQNQQLSKLRDWLLPMLMNGQVTVKEAEERISIAAEPGVEYKKR